MARSAPILMYWPNETSDDLLRGQVGPRRAFENMHLLGVLSGYTAISYRQVRKRFQDEAGFAEWTANQLKQFKPDVLYVQHPSTSGVSHITWEAVRSTRPDLKIVYHEADVYDRWFKRVTREVVDLAKVADALILCALGSNESLFRSLSQAPIEFMPHCFDNVRFGKRDPRAIAKQCEAIMIGNCVHPFRLPFLYLPGGKRRAELAALLELELGDGFFLYGSGWDRRSSYRGPLDYLDQEIAIQSARVSVNWDHYDHLPMYFSDRLPISLAAGIPHVTSWHPAYDEFFKGCPGLYLAHSPEEALACTRELLKRSDEELLNEGSAARAWVSKKLEADIVFREGVLQTLKGLGLQPGSNSCLA